MEAIEAVVKFILCVLLTQFGKTFTAISRISQEIKRDSEAGRSIHLVWTMNTLLNNSQFSNRLNSIEREYGKGSVAVLASKKQGNDFRHIRDLTGLLGICFDAHTCPRVVVMCSNDTRYEDGFKFVNILESNHTNIERVFAYYDELHNYITDKLRGQIEDLDKLNIVKGIMALTATPNDILLKEGYWSSLRMFSLDDFNETDYAGYSDMVFNTQDDFFAHYVRPGPFDFERHDENTIGFIKHVLDKYPAILSEGSRCFIPAHKRRVGHKRVRAEIFERCKTAVVVVLNGEEKTLKYRDSLYFVDSDGSEKTIPLHSPAEEVCDTIARIVTSNSLEGRPLVITGYICVGMGQTLLTKRLGTFTSAILSHLDLTNDDLYQLFGRLTARSKNWGDKYCPTVVYCPTLAMNRIQAWEECARRLAKDYSGKDVTEADYRKPLAEMGTVGVAALDNVRVKHEKKVKVVKPSVLEHPTPFETLAEVNEFLKGVFKKPFNVRSFKKCDDGYTVSTRLNTYYHKIAGDLKDADRLTMEFFRKIQPGTNVSRTEGSGQPYMVYPVYATMESAASDVKYYVRYMPPQAPPADVSALVGVPLQAAGGAGGPSSPSGPAGPAAAPARI